MILKAAAGSAGNKAVNRVKAPERPDSSLQYPPHNENPKIYDLHFLICFSAGLLLHVGERTNGRNSKGKTSAVCA
jgi:hypothetical protein